MFFVYLTVPSHLHRLSFIFLLTITIMATVQNFQIFPDKFNVVGIRTGLRYAQKPLIYFHRNNLQFLIALLCRLKH